MTSGAHVLKAHVDVSRRPTGLVLAQRTPRLELELLHLPPMSWVARRPPLGPVLGTHPGLSGPTLRPDPGSPGPHRPVHGQAPRPPQLASVNKKVLPEALPGLCHPRATQLSETPSCCEPPTDPQAQSP